MMLNPAARVLWRARDTVQLELGGRAVLVEGVDTEVIRQLEPRLAAQARSGAVPAAALDGAGLDGRALGGPALDTLTEGGYLWPRADRIDDERLRPPAPRLGAELTALAARHGPPAATILAVRQRFSVAVHGTGRAAAHIAALLAASGIGRLHVVDADDVRLHHAVPGGICPADEGRPFRDAVAGAVRRAAPEADVTPLPIGRRPDLVVLAFDEPIDTERREALHARGCTHLAVSLGADYGVVGPLVIPGLTSCLRCADLHRRDRDPAWSALAVQLTVPRPHGPVSDAALATIVAGAAVVQALAYLDGGEPATIEGTLEVHLPDWRLRRRSWPMHPDCECAGER